MKNGVPVYKVYTKFCCQTTESEMENDSWVHQFFEFDP